MTSGSDSDVRKVAKRIAFSGRILLPLLIATFVLSAMSLIWPAIGLPPASWSSLIYHYWLPWPIRAFETVCLLVIPVALWRCTRISAKPNYRHICWLLRISALFFAGISLLHLWQWQFGMTVMSWRQAMTLNWITAIAATSCLILYLQVAKNSRWNLFIQQITGALLIVLYFLVAFATLDHGAPLISGWMGDLLSYPYREIRDLAITFAAAVIIFRVSAVASRIGGGKCPRCRYDLRTDLWQGCPECGWCRNEFGSRP